MPEDIRSADEFFDAVKLVVGSYPSKSSRNAAAKGFGFADADEMDEWYMEERKKRMGPFAPSPKWSIQKIEKRNSDGVLEETGNRIIAGRCSSFNFGVNGFHVVVSEEDYAELVELVVKLWVDEDKQDKLERGRNAGDA